MPVPVVIHTVHNQAEHEADFLGRMVQRFAFRRRVIPVAISNQIARSVERVYGIQCKEVIPNCIALERFAGEPADRLRWREEHGFSRDAVLLISAGRLEAQKDPLTLLQAFAAVADPHVHLLMLGDGALQRDVAELVRSLKVEPRVHLLGKRDDVASMSGGLGYLRHGLPLGRESVDRDGGDGLGFAGRGHCCWRRPRSGRVGRARDTGSSRRARGTGPRDGVAVPESG